MAKAGSSNMLPAAVTTINPFARRYYYPGGTRVA